MQPAAASWSRSRLRDWGLYVDGVLSPMPHQNRRSALHVEALTRRVTMENPGDSGKRVQTAKEMDKPVLGTLCFALGLVVGAHHDRLVKEASIYNTAASSGAESGQSVSILGRREAGGSGHRRRTFQDLDPEAKPAPRDVSEFLARHGRSSHALMAAGLAAEDPELLREAVRQSPDDPHLQLLALAEDLFPGERLERARRFKASQPGNALASYLLADQLIKEGSALPPSGPTLWNSCRNLNRREQDREPKRSQ